MVLRLRVVPAPERPPGSEGGEEGEEGGEEGEEGVCTIVLTLT